ncbi:beta-1,3-mannanase [Mytilinidion resinicola]|uniref:mannan endo-1,4-beta-mannosidase n=1 Tax=Mytilinidion resinicola TaxID=574789 RepID=A0A6A6Z7F5_9PEZI|nr:beta-1,3-mannanase [Mytilinidion resinicola]KAF2816613.1 beta-1,3-mannanase [Mytilinidion resinicola]
MPIALSWLLPALMLANSNLVRSAPVENAVAGSWAGSNLYTLHALPAADQKTYIETLAGRGAKVLRLWVVGSDGGCVKGSPDVQKVADLETTVGTYDTSVLDALDNTLKIMADNGMKAIISPHNANSIAGFATCDAYCTKFGTGTNFYTSNEAKSAYDARLKTIISYNSPNFGKAWGELFDVILAFDLQNEPMIGAIDYLNGNDESDWLCGRAGNLKALLNGSGVKIATGGIGGSQYDGHEFNLLDKAIRCSAIDIMSVHGYMGTAANWAYFVGGDKDVISAAKNANKHVMIEEWGVDSKSTDDFDKQAQVFNKAGIPWLYWQVIPGKDETESGHQENCGYDGYEIGLASSKGDVAGAIKNANAATAAQDWTGFL